MSRCVTHFTGCECQEKRMALLQAVADAASWIEFHENVDGGYVVPSERRVRRLLNALTNLNEATEGITGREAGTEVRSPMEHKRTGPEKIAYDEGQIEGQRYMLALIQQILDGDDTAPHGIVTVNDHAYKSIREQIESLKRK